MKTIQQWINDHIDSAKGKIRKVFGFKVQEYDGRTVYIPYFTISLDRILKIENERNSTVILKRTGEEKPPFDQQQVGTGMVLAIYDFETKSYLEYVQLTQVHGGPEDHHGVIDHHATPILPPTIENQL